MNTTTYITRFSVIGITLSIMYLSPVAMGGELTIPKSWSPDETLTAKDLNDNFQAIKSAVDDNAFLC